MSTDLNGNVYLACSFSYSVAYGPFSYTGPNGGTYISLVKYDSQGNAKWAKFFGYLGCSPYFGLCTGKDGGVYFTFTMGAFDSLNIDGHILNNNQQQDDMILAKFDSLGNTKWIRETPNPYYIYPYGLVLDQNENIYVTGIFGNAFQFANDMLACPGYSVNTSNEFLLKYTGDGYPVWG